MCIFPWGTIALPFSGIWNLVGLVINQGNKNGWHLVGRRSSSLLFYQREPMTNATQKRKYWTVGLLTASKGESMTSIVGSLTANMQAWCWSCSRELASDAKAAGRESECVRLGLAWTFKASKHTPSDRPPIMPHLSLHINWSQTFYHMSLLGATLIQTTTEIKDVLFSSCMGQL